MITSVEPATPSWGDALFDGTLVSRTASCLALEAFTAPKSA